MQTADKRSERRAEPGTQPPVQNVGRGDPGGWEPAGVWLQEAVWNLCLPSVVDMGLYL